MIRLSPPSSQISGSISIGGSKSLSNRMLILSEILKQNVQFENLSDSEDTRILQNALELIRNASKQKQTTIDIGKAGTDMRFLTALLAITEGEWLLTGSDRMKQRPIAPLVDALIHLGADIQYTEQIGYPPVKIKGKRLDGGELTIKADVSSQFISALLLIAASMNKGLKIKLSGPVVSRPYIDMTLEVLRSANVLVGSDNDLLGVEPLKMANTREAKVLNIESDWSSASYWYSFCALSKNSRIKLQSFYKLSSQADSVLPEIYKNLGVKTQFEGNYIELTNVPLNASDFSYNFNNCPDLAQTLAVTCFGLGIPSLLNGLSTLKLKETDRIAALKTELENQGAKIEAGQDFIRIAPGMKLSDPQKTPINTYDDHRMAMSFAPLCLVQGPILISDPEVVSKSYPNFWNDLKSVGFSVNLQA